MSIALRTVQLANFTRIKALSIPENRFYQVFAPLSNNPTAPAFQASLPCKIGKTGSSQSKMSQIPGLKLNDGNEIPMLGYGCGTARYKANPNAPLDQETVKTIVLGINSGYYHLDGAEVYGNEPELGQAIKESGLPREKFYITTKISGIKVQDTKQAFELSLKKLGLDYVDQYLIHAPFFAKGPEDLQAKWADMEAIHASGKAKTIGVSNFLKPDLEAVLKTAKVVPAINQIEYHPYLQHDGLVEFHNKHGIATSAYAPLTAVVKAKPGPLDGTYEKLAKKYGVTPGEIALRWVLDQGIVVLTTSSNEQRLKGFLKVSQFKLTSEEVEEISKIGKQKNFRGFWQDKFAADDWS
ncbi:NADPH-dependent conjugated polyketone reductase C1 [Lachnellula suecica]|uniref:NADPH-dependent conjugated polyketone reductase C1 n=1 Tax=Lachnellula suecica TaxID=602035 RepID=A0A8T9CL43_9HELO|nr:NADPH-dependent conjugated polyketone reductase C1 [Lachnellula suecica]